MIEIMDKFKEECGVFGISNKDTQASYDVYDGLFALQHRGQESAGIASFHQGEMQVRKKWDLCPRP